MIGFYTCRTKVKEITFPKDVNELEEIDPRTDKINGVKSEFKISVFDLAYLGVDRKFQNKNYGVGIIKNIIDNVCRAYLDNHICLSAITLNSLSDPREFYEKMGFRYLKGFKNVESPFLNEYPMIMTMPQMLDTKSKI